MWHEAHYAAAVRLFTAARNNGIQLIAPEFWLIECANGCWKRVHRRMNSATEVRSAYRAITDLKVAKLNTSDLADVVLDMALENRTTSYDALYIATAQFADAPLITTDTKLLDTLRAAQWPGRAMHLSEY